MASTVSAPRARSGAGMKTLLALAMRSNSGPSRSGVRTAAQARHIVEHVA